MLRPKAVEAYDKTLNSVVSDLIAKLRLCKSPEGLITDITSEFYRFGLEGKALWRIQSFQCAHLPPSVAHILCVILLLTGVSSVLFESRIGCLDQIVPEETERFIQAINTMFVMTLPTMAMPSWLHQLFPKPWKVFCQSWDYMFEFGTLSPMLHCAK